MCVCRRSLSTACRSAACVLLLDSPGADNPMCAGQQSGAPLSKLLSNYLQVLFLFSPYCIYGQQHVIQLQFHISANALEIRTVPYEGQSVLSDVLVTVQNCQTFPIDFQP
jgi:hypothetical protein